MQKDSVNCDESIVNQYLTDNESKLFHLCNNLYSNRETQFHFANRDTLMASRAETICNLYLRENETATLYCHFLHANYIAEQPTFLHSSPSAGSILKQKYRDDYACLAMTAAQGNRYVTPLNNRTEVSTLPPAPIGSFERIIDSSTDDLPIYIPMSNLRKGDICQLRTAGISAGPTDFINLEPQAFMDGIVIVKNATHLDIEFTKTKQEVDTENMSYHFQQMMKMVERVKHIKY